MNGYTAPKGCSPKGPETKTGKCRGIFHRKELTDIKRTQVEESQEISQQKLTIWFKFC